MAVPPKKQKEMIDRQAKIAKMYLEGKTQIEIAIILKCAVGTVNRDLKILEKRWLESALSDTDKRKAEEIAKINRLEAQAWDSFFESRKVIEKGEGRRKKPPQKSGGKPSESTSHFSKQTISAGDPRFLSIISECIERRCRIIGIDAPGKIELSGRDGGAIEYETRSEIAIHQLAGLLKSNGVSLTDDDDEQTGDEND